jgi:hypothetical protein
MGQLNWLIAKKKPSGVSPLWPFHLHLKSTLRQNKNYGNSNISPCQNPLIFRKKSSKEETKILPRYYIITL